MAQERISNGLLSLIVKFLNTRDESIEKLQDLINESTSEQLVPSFAFLGFWITSNVNKNLDPIGKAKVQSAFHLMGLLTSKIPPIILLSGISDLNWGSDYEFWMIAAFQPILERIRKIRLLSKPFSLESEILRHHHTFIDNDLTPPEKFPVQIFEFENDPGYQVSTMIHFRYLILNHSSIDTFSLLLEKPNARVNLTYSIIDIIDKLNSERKAKHSQLIFTFSMIFQYIHAFSVSNLIDGQLLCDYLRSVPFISPFCLIAIVNHIQPSNYLFNLLIPVELMNCTIKSEEEVIKAINNQYRIVDMSTDNTLNKLIEYTPKILCRYFAPNIKIDYKEDIGKTLCDRLIYFLLNDSIPLKKAKTLINCIKEEQFCDNDECSLYGPVFVSGLNFSLISATIYALQHSFVECCNAKVFTPSVDRAIELILSMLFTVNYESITNKILDNVGKNDISLELMIRSIFKKVRITANHPIYKTTLPYLLKSISEGSSDPSDQRNSLSSVSLVVLLKYLSVVPPKISNSIVDDIINCNDLLVQLYYIEELDKDTDVNLCTELNMIQKSRERIIESIPFNSNKKSPYIIICDSNAIKLHINKYDEITKQCLNAYLTISTMISTQDAYNFLDKVNIEVLFFFVMTSLIANNNIAVAITNYVVKLLVEPPHDIGKHAPGNECQFKITQNDVGLLLAEILLKRLLFFKHSNLVPLLIEKMIPMLIRDSMPLHWFTRFLKHNWKYLTAEMKSMFLHNFLYKLPYASKYIYKQPNMIKNIGLELNKLLHTVPQDPNSIEKEYGSSFNHLIAFSICNILLTANSVSEAVHIIADPMLEISKPWKDKATCCESLAKVVTGMPADICLEFFKTVVDHMPSLTGVSTMKVFLIYADLETIKSLCASMKTIIGGNETKLRDCLHIVTSSYIRLKGDPQSATQLLCGFLDNVTSKTKKELQEEIIDAVGLVYLSLKLHKSRALLINASSRFPPEMKSIIAISLELTDTSNHIEAKSMFDPKMQSFSSIKF